MSIFFLNAAPAPALNSLWECVQAPQVSFDALSPIVADLWEQTGTPEALGMDPQECRQIQGALQALNQEAARLSDASGRIQTMNLQPSLQSLASSWPVRFRAPKGHLASGGCSSVRLGYDTDVGEMVTIKAAERAEGVPVSLAVIECLLSQEHWLLEMLQRDRPGAGPRVFRLERIEGKLCMVMEYLHGTELSQLHGSALIHGLKGDADLDRLLDLCRQAVAQVAALHEQGIVHCDVKPENFMYHQQRLRIFDLGIALFEGEKHLSPTGTPVYMAPEVWPHETPAEFSRDVFALGVTLYWLMTGVSPFEADSPGEIARKVMLSDPEPPSEVLLRSRPDLRDELSPTSLANLRAFDRIVMKAFSKVRESRYQNANEMLADLQSRLQVEPLPQEAALFLQDAV